MSQLLEFLQYNKWYSCNSHTGEYVGSPGLNKIETGLLSLQKQGRFGGRGQGRGGVGNSVEVLKKENTHIFDKWTNFKVISP